MSYLTTHVRKLNVNYDHTNIFMSLLTDRKTSNHQPTVNEIDTGVLDSHYYYCENETVMF